MDISIAMSTRFLLLVCTLSLHVTSNMAQGDATSGFQVRQLGSLAVRRGRSAFLNPRDLVVTLPGTPQFSAPEVDDDTASGGSSEVEPTTCIVEVVDDDPMTQRVGTLSPKAFSCDLPPYTVRYTHNGSPLMSSDQVLLLVRHFTSNHVTTEKIYLAVDIVEAPYEVFIQESRLRSLRVPEYFGYTSAISPSVLHFRYNYYNGATCTVSLNKDVSGWPKLGQIVTLENEEEITELTHDCRDFLYLGLRYRHNSPPTPDMDYLPLTVQLDDPVQSSDPVVERLFLPIVISGAYPNLAPTATYLDSYVMEIDQYALRTLSHESMSAKDSETPAEELIFNISRGPSVGYFVHRDSPTKRIYSFLQRDLINRNVAYQAPGPEFVDEVTISVQFTVYDAHCTASSTPIELHIHIEPSKPTSLHVMVRNGLYVMEGETTPLTDDDLIIRSDQATSELMIHVKGGLRHGRLTVRGLATQQFTPDDLHTGHVIYHHDNSDALEDRIFFRITNGKYTTRVKVPVHVIPKDDDAPSLIVNEGIEVRQNNFVKITPLMLSAHDKDSPSEDVLFVIKTQPTTGEIVIKNSPHIRGHQVSVFSQADLDSGLVYYQHLRDSDSVNDLFEFKLSDKHEPPNRSGKYSVQVVIHEVLDMPPQSELDTSHQALAEETEILFFGHDELYYRDVESGPSDITYTISSQPFFLTTTITIDAGRIIRVDGNDSTANYNKHSQLPAVHSFTQTDIDQSRIAYVPPFEDIGPIRRQARFIYSVSDGAGNTILNQFFDITLLPVNNRIPHMIINKVNVEEGGTASISTNEISAYDPDTDQSSLTFLLDTLPLHGTLWNEDEQLHVGSQFTMTHLILPTIRYQHDGTEETVDQFYLSITDGTNTATKIVPISITLINDNAPEVGYDLVTQIEVEEGGYVVISTDNLSATDDDTDDMTLRFVLVRSPQYGDIQVGSEPATEFTQHDIHRGIVRYVHTSGEIGIDAVSDSATFAVRDEMTESLNIHGPLLDLNVTILPIDNTHPYVILGGPIFVNEGGHMLITTDALGAHDMDTPMDGLRFVITSSPTWGIIRNTRTSEVVDSFTLLDITDKVIRYVQSNHSGLEPLSDAFEVYVTDGGRSSHPSMVQISIVPQNDEVPELFVTNITITEGEKHVIKVDNLIAMDVDLPSENLRISFQQLPAHGMLSVIIGGLETGRESPLPPFIDSYELGTNVHLIYTHDSSENFEDSFLLDVSDGFRVSTKRVYVTVVPNNDEIPRITTNMGVAVLFGSVSLISSVVLETVDTDSSSDQLYYIVLSIPEKGYLQLKQGNPPGVNDYDLQDANWINLSVTRNFTQRDIDTNRLRYVHTGNLHDEPRDQFIFHVTDGRYRTPKDTFTITILRTKNEAITLESTVLNVREGDSKTITEEYLSASEGASMPGQLVYYITGHPSHGHLSLAGTYGHVVESFTQRDVMADKLLYTHTASNDVEDLSMTVSDDRFYYTVMSTVNNGVNRTRSGVFRLHIEPLDRQLPTLDTLMPLTVVQSYEELLSSANLHVSDPDTITSNLTYIITDPPVHGKLLNRDVPVTSFTQYDLDQEYISYRSNTSDDVGIDFFLFTVTDNSHTGYLINGTYQESASFFSILIQPLSKEIPMLRHKNAPNELQYYGKGKYGFSLSRENLYATQPLSGSDDIVYSLLVRPEQGLLYNKVTKRGIKKRFTQYDLDESNVVYMLYDDTKITNDSFTFRIQDSYRNTLDNQRLSLSWSILELAQPTYVVCEDAGSVAITVQRTGRTDGTARVEIRAKGLTAKEGQDYISSAQEQLQFNPGEKSVTWTVEILRDNIKERDEKLRITLRSPSNAILGRNDKASVNIINYNNGRCADYIGMISSSEPQFTSIDELHNAVIKKPIYGEMSPNGGVRYGYRPYRDEARTTMRYPPVHTTRGPATRNTQHELPRTQQEWDDLLLQTEDEVTWVDDDVYYNTIDTENPTDWASPVSRKKTNKQRNSAKGKRSKNHPNHNIQTQPQGIVAPPTEEMDDSLQQIAPQPCDRDTKGLLYYNLHTSVMFRCDGSMWVTWDHNQSHNKMYQTAPLESDEQGEEGGEEGGEQLVNIKKECSQGWSKFHDYCYKPIVAKETWFDAEQRCTQVYDSHLAHIETVRHLEWMWTLADRQPFWIGLNDKRSHHIWEYTAEAPVRFYNWRRGFPTSQRSLGKNCVLVSREKEWVNRPCTKNTARYICMKPAKTYNHNKKRRRRNHWQP